MQKISNIKLKPFEDEYKLLDKACKIAKISPSNVKYFKLIKKSLDARRKDDVYFNCTVELSTKPYVKPQVNYGKVSKKGEVLVVGAGPAGLFCALDLLRYGLNVTLVDKSS